MAGAARRGRTAATSETDRRAEARAENERAAARAKTEPEVLAMAADRLWRNRDPALMEPLAAVKEGQDPETMEARIKDAGKAGREGLTSLGRNDPAYAGAFVEAILSDRAWTAGHPEIDEILDTLAIPGHRAELRARVEGELCACLARVPAGDLRSLLAVVARAAALPPAAATVRAVGGMAKRPAVVSQSRMASWTVDAGRVDGEPVAVLQPDPGSILRQRSARKRRPRAVYKPGDAQGNLRLPRGMAAPVPVDLRLAALAGLSGVLAGDVLELGTLAYAVRRPMVLSVKDGAALLARTRDGGYRRARASDEARFHEATAELHAILLRAQPRGQWLEMADVRGLEGGGYIIGPPSWARTSTRLRWTLTAEGSRVAQSRIAAGAGGRLITGIEYALAAIHDGEAGIAPYLMPDGGKAGNAGPVLKLPMPALAALMGAGDVRPEIAGKAGADAARKRLERAIDAVYENGAYRAKPSPTSSAAGGDAVEIVGRTRGGGGRYGELWVRAGARFVEAARLAQRGRGFEAVPFEEWTGMKDLAGPDAE